jgi:hypothetical protein
MSRTDLLALTPESLASLANVGLVKRAQRELAGGEGPTLSEDAGGVVTGTFKDGVVARLVPNKTLKETPCTCGAPGVCRHRIAVALAYRDHHARASSEAAPPDTWSPADLDDAHLEAVVGPRVMARARALTDGGLLAEVDGGPPFERPPSVQLPTCSVQFLVPRDLAYARCSCALGTGCEHVVAAVWAFRASRQAGVRQVSLGRAARVVNEGWGDALALSREILSQGVAQGTGEVVQRFARVRVGLTHARLVWPLTIVEDLEQQIEAYHARSMRYRARAVADLVTELELRARAVRGGGELPPAFVAGTNEADDTLLDHVRLVGLGARVEADGRARYADVFLADPDAGIVLVLRKRWDAEPSDGAMDGPALARRPIAARATLGALAAGQVVSKGVRRRANRSLTIGTSRVRDTSVTPQDPDWDRFPPAILVRDFGAHAAERATLAPKMLRPRVLAEHVRVIAVQSVRDVIYIPAEQELVATLCDERGATVRLSVRHRAVAPHALDAVGAALGQGLRFVAGELRLGPAGLQIDPACLVTDHLIVPDLVASPAAWEAPHAVRAPIRNALDAVLTEAESTLEEAVQLGLVPPRADWLGRIVAVRKHLDDAGLASVAARFADLERAARETSARAIDRRAGSTPALSPCESIDAWLRASMRVALARHVVG